MPDLKPCPFCGRRDKLKVCEIKHHLDDFVIKQYSVFCDASGDKTGCGASCGYRRTKAEAITAWNRRKDNAMKPEVERSGGGTTWWHVCGACKTAINPNDKYCHECGVSIDWGRNDA